MVSFSVSCPKSTAGLFKGSPTQQPNNSFTTTAISRSRNAFLSAASSSSSSLHHPNFLLTFQGSTRPQSAIWKVHSQLNEVADKSTNSASAPEAKFENKKDDPKEEPAVSDPASVSAFMTQVADLVKLVDSRDIVELQLKQLDCEVTIRKKEALPQVSAPASVVMMQPQSYQAAPASQPPPAPSPPPASASPPSVPALPAPKASTSSHPPLKSPMAGTFYRCPAPGEPPFVKVGDKVQKGQVICIIEAMKLMNEIEADQSGTVTEILMEDGKPVSVETPLFVIAP